MTQGEKRPYSHGFLARSHETASDEVDDDDVVGVDGVPETERVGDDGCGSEISLRYISINQHVFSLR